MNEQATNALRDALMSMTETEAAALAMLQELDAARDVLRSVIERGGRR